MSAEIIAIVGTGMGIIIAMGALVITLFLHSISKMDKMSEDSKTFREAWAQETKEFHGRLTAIETDFKNFMKREEERRTKILNERR